MLGRQIITCVFSIRMPSDLHFSMRVSEDVKDINEVVPIDLLEREVVCILEEFLTPDQKSCTYLWKELRCVGDTCMFFIKPTNY